MKKQESNPNSFNKRELRITTFNTCLLPHILFPHHCQGLRVDRMMNACFIRKPDVLVLQEAFDSSAKGLIDGLKTIYPFYTKILREDEFINAGVVILSKFNLENVEYVTFKNNSNMEWIVNKGFIFVRLSKNHTYFNILGVHLQDCDDETLLKQVGEMREFLQEKYDSKAICRNESVLIAGGLNADGNSELFEKILCELNFSKCTPLEDCKYSFDPETNSFCNYRYPDNGRCTIDHVICNKSFLTPKIAHVEVVDEKCDEWYSWLINKSFNNYSDHYPVCYTLKY